MNKHISFKHKTDGVHSFNKLFGDVDFLQRYLGNNYLQSPDQAEPTIAPPGVHDVLRSPGRPLDPQTRNFMESRLDYDFSQVRVHTDSPAAESSRAIDALAYTVGQNVVFGAGQYAPKTSEGKQLLAHELTHVVQQTRPSGQRVLSSGNQAEQEAGVNRQRIVAGEVVKVKNRSTNGAIQREKKPTPKGGVKLESGFEKTSEGITNKYSFDANVKYSLDRSRYFIEDIKISLKGSAKSGEPIDITAPEIAALQAQIALGLLNLEAPKLTLPANIGELSFGAKLGTTTSLSQTFGEEGALTPSLGTTASLEGSFKSSSLLPPGLGALALAAKLGTSASLADIGGAGTPKLGATSSLGIDYKSPAFRSHFATLGGVLGTESRLTLGASGTFSGGLEPEKGLSSKFGAGGTVGLTGKGAGGREVFVNVRFTGEVGFDFRNRKFDATTQKFFFGLGAGTTF